MQRGDACAAKGKIGSFGSMFVEEWIRVIDCESDGEAPRKTMFMIPGKTRKIYGRLTRGTWCNWDTCEKKRFFKWWLEKPREWRERKDRERSLRVSKAFSYLLQSRFVGFNVYQPFLSTALHLHLSLWTLRSCACHEVQMPPGVIIKSLPPRRCQLHGASYECNVRLHCSRRFDKKDDER